MNLKFEKKCVSVYLTFLFFGVAFLLSLLFCPAANRNSSGLKQFNSVARSAQTSRHVLDYPGIRARTNSITGFSNLWSMSGEYNYRLCDVLTSGYWKPGIVVTDKDQNFLAAWSIPSNFNSQNLTNLFTTHIAIGNSDTEVFVLLGILNMKQAIDDAYLRNRPESIYIVRLNFEPARRMLTLTQLIPFSYPLDAARAWFSNRGKYAQSKPDQRSNKYHLGRYGYIHFLAYGHLFAYNNVGTKTNAIDEFLLVPTLIKRSRVLGGLYAPAATSSRGETSRTTFSQLKTWQSIARDGGKVMHENVRKSNLTPDMDRNISLYSTQEIKRMVNADSYPTNDGNELLMQPGWCVFRPFSSLTRFVSPALEQPINVVGTDAVGVFTQLDTIFRQSKRIIQAVRIVGTNNQTLFSKPTHIIHFTANWEWLSGHERQVNRDMVSFETTPTEVSPGVRLDLYGWRLVNYRELIVNRDLHVSAVAIDINQAGDLKRGIDIYENGFAARASSALGTSIPFMIFGYGDGLKVHTGKLSGDRYVDERDAAPLKIFSGLQRVVEIVPFQVGNLTGEGMLIIAKNGLLTYRFHDAKLGYSDINENQFLRTNVPIEMINLIFFHPQNKLVEENLVRMTMKFFEEDNLQLLGDDFLLEWTADRKMLMPLKRSEGVGVELVAKIPKRYEALTSLQIAAMDQNELLRDFVANRSMLEKAKRKYDSVYLAVHHVSDGENYEERNRLALSLKLKSGLQTRTGFVRMSGAPTGWNSVVIFSGISDGQKYFAVFKPRHEVKKMPISQYSVGQIYEMYNGDQRSSIEKELVSLVKIEPDDLRENWRHSVRIVDANAITNTLSLEAFIIIDEYHEPLKIKGSDTTIMTYNDVFYKPSYTWVYFAVICGLALIIILSLGFGIGIPMRRQQKINLMNAKLANTRFERIAEAMLNSAQAKPHTQQKSSEHQYLLEESSSNPNYQYDTYYLPAPTNPNKANHYHLNHGQKNSSGQWKKSKKYPPKGGARRK